MQKEVKNLNKLTNKELPKIEPMTQATARITAQTQDRLIEIAAKRVKDIPHL